MKKTALLITAFLLSTGSLFAAETASNESNQVLSKAKFKANKINYNIEKVFDKKNTSVSLKAKNDKGDVVWQSESIGDFEKLTNYNGEIKSILIKDLDKNGTPEIIAGAMNGPNASFLYIYTFTNGRFRPIPFTYPESNFSRNFLVSDIYDPENRDVVINKDGRIKAAGKKYTPDGPVVAFYYFNLVGNEYQCSKVEPIAVKPEKQEGKSIQEKRKEINEMKNKLEEKMNSNG